MRTVLVGVSVAVLAACGGGDGGQVTLPQADAADLAEAQAAAGELGETLKGRRVAAMTEGGPVAAIDVCAQEAPAIAANVSARRGLEVGRTALRVRNGANAPDDWETAQLEAFAAALAEGESPAGLTASEVVEMDGRAHLRWMSPIPTGDACAACHGAVISPEVQAAVDARYPGDQATGFAPGELRGAFTVTKPLD